MNGCGTVSTILLFSSCQGDIRWMETLPRLLNRQIDEVCVTEIEGKNRTENKIRQLEKEKEVEKHQEQE